MNLVCICCSKFALKNNVFAAFADLTLFLVYWKNNSTLSIHSLFLLTSTNSLSVMYLVVPFVLINNISDIYA